MVPAMVTGSLAVPGRHLATGMVTRAVVAACHLRELREVVVDAGNVVVVTTLPAMWCLGHVCLSAFELRRRRHIGPQAARSAQAMSLLAAQGHAGAGRHRRLCAQRAQTPGVPKAPRQSAQNAEYRS